MKNSILLLTIFLMISFTLKAQDTLTILHINDTHSCLAPLGPRNENLEGTQGGISRAATVIGMTKMTEQNVLTLHGGDSFIGDLFFNKFLSVPEFQILNSLGLDAMAVGNHEFDLTPAYLDTALRNSFPPGYGFPLISSNVNLDDPTVQPLKDYIFPFITKQVGNVKVGMFSLLTPETNLFSQPDSAKVSDDIAGTALVMIDTLNSLGCDLIICLSHLGILYDQDIASNIPGINIIISAHDHLRTDQPVEITDPLDRTTYIVQADAFYKCIGKMKIAVTQTGMELIDYSLINLDETIPEEPTIKATIDGLISEIENTWGPVYTQQIGTATDFFKEVATNLGENGSHDTPIGNLVTDAYRWKTGTEIGITVGGSTAQPIYQGPLVGADAFRVVGYGFNEVNGLGFRIVKFKLTGADLIAGLELGLSMAEYNDELLPQVSGMKYYYNLARPSFSRIEYVEVGGVPIDLQQEYYITSNEFLLMAITKMLSINVINPYLFADSSEFQILSEYIINQQTISPEYRGGVIADIKVIENIELPTDFKLGQNYPNPFNPSTKISWQSPVGSWQTIKIYDVLGNEVVTLVDEYKPAGSYEVEFSGHSDEGQNLSSGVYFYQLKANNFIETKKMILLR